MPHRGEPSTATPQALPQIPARLADPRTTKKRRRRLRRTIIVAVLVVLIAWPIGLLAWANSKLNHVDALSDMSNTPGTTYLIAGSDERPKGSEITGARADTIMLLTKPASGVTSLVSIPRDTYVEIPGHGGNKINAAYAFGGPKLLVTTVEKLTGMKVDHVVEVGFSGVSEVVDAVGGVELCLDYDVKDKKSELNWKAGCHKADGKTALAFSRMRYADKEGDLGRVKRQQQVISAISKKAMEPATFLEPWRQVQIAGGATAALRVDEKTSVITLGQMVLAFKSATGSGGYQGTPPIASTNYQPGGIGSAVLLDPDKTPGYFKSIADGTKPSS